MKLNIDEKLLSHMAMLIFSLMVSGSFVLGNLIADDIEPELLTFYRFLIGSVILGVFLISTNQFQYRDYTSPWRFIILGALYSVYFVFMFFALKYTSTISTSAIFTLMPLFSAVLALVFLKEKGTFTVWTALLISCIGALWIIFEGSAEKALKFSFDEGELIFLMGTICHAAYAIIQPRLNRGESVHAITLGVLIAGTFILAISLAYQGINFSVDDMSWKIALITIYLTVFSTILSMSCLNYASNNLSAPNVTAYTLLVPFWVLLFDNVFFGVMTSVYVALGIVPILVGLCFLYFRG